MKTVKIGYFLAILLAAASAGTGCSRSASPEGAAWPKQSGPAYPAPPASDAAPSSGATVRQTPAEASENGASPLAKEYSGKAVMASLEGKATYYGDSLAGNHTASGEVYDPVLFTAAHKKLSFGTIVRVTRIDTNRVTYVKINDRGPFGPADRIIDLSRAAAEELAMIKAGVVAVRVEVLDSPTKQ